MDLSQAIGSLGRALNQASAAAGESGFRVKPVELTLQVIAERSGADPERIEWRVLTTPPGDVGVAHVLKLRLESRDAEAEPGRRSSAAHRVDAAAARLEAATRSPEALGPLRYAYSAGIRGDRVRGPGPQAREPNREQPGEPADVRWVTAAQVACYTSADPFERGARERDDLSDSREYLVIERTAVDVPADQAGALSRILAMYRAAQPGDGTRERLLDATSEYVAGVLESQLCVTTRWATRNPLDPATSANIIDHAQEWLNEVITKPLETAGDLLGGAPGVTEIAAGIGADFVLAPEERIGSRAAEILDVACIVIGFMTGNHALVFGHLHDLATRELHHEIVQGVREAVTDFGRNPAASPSDRTPGVARAARPAVDRPLGLSTHPVRPLPDVRPRARPTIVQPIVRPSEQPSPAEPTRRRDIGRPGPGIGRGGPFG